MDDVLKIILAAVGASGLFGLIFTSVTNRTLNKLYRTQDHREDLRNENEFLMMTRIDALADMTHLMANKLHDAGVINGDLEELNAKYQELDDKYQKNLKHLALEVLKK